MITYEQWIRMVKARQRELFHKYVDWKTRKDYNKARAKATNAINRRIKYGMVVPVPVQPRVVKSRHRSRGEGRNRYSRRR